MSLCFHCFLMCLPNSLQLIPNLLHDNLFPFLHPPFLGMEFLSCYLLDSCFRSFSRLGCHMRFLSHLQPFCYVSAGSLEDFGACRLTFFYLYFQLTYNLPSLILSPRCCGQGSRVIRIVRVRCIVFYVLVLLYYTTF